MAPPVTAAAAAHPPHARPGAVLRAMRIIHPFPALLNVTATAGLAFVATSGAPEPSVIARMLLVMLCAQSAIGITNDYVDRSLDARTKPWKPIVAGYVPPTTAAVAALALIAATAAVASTLGATGFALAMLGLACGLAYDVRLKRSALSAVPFMVAIPTLPLWVWATVGEWQPVLWWLLPLGALIGLALHLANTLPDIEGDAAEGVTGLAHRLGARRSMSLGWAAFALALLWSAALAPFIGYDLRVYVPAAIFGVSCLAGSIGLYAARRDGFALRFGFGALGVGSAVLAVAWLASL